MNLLGLALPAVRHERVQDKHIVRHQFLEQVHEGCWQPQCRASALIRTSGSGQKEAFTFWCCTWRCALLFDIANAPYHCFVNFKLFSLQMRMIIIYI